MVKLINILSNEGFNSLFKEIDLNEAMEMIDDCEMNSSSLTDWECDFVDSLSKQLDENESITKEQYSKLEQIHEEKC